MAKWFNRERGGNAYHSLREEICRAIDDAGRPMSPNELSQVLREGLSAISYHVTVLKEAGALRLDSTAQRRGAMEHFYVLTPGVLVEENAPERALQEIVDLLPGKRKRAGLLKQIGEIAEGAGA